MFEISSKAHYGLQALFDLAQHYDRGLVQIKDIVQRHDIPRNYLEQIFNRLTKQGIVRSVRGNKGGYQLAAPPSEVQLLTIMQALEGDIASTGDIPIESVRTIFAGLEQHIRSSLAVSLAESVERERLLSGNSMYYI
jgi:Rrf2 family protein